MILCDLVCDLFALGPRDKEVVGGEIMGQLMRKQSAIKIRDQDLVLMGNKRAIAI